MCKCQLYFVIFNNKMDIGFSRLKNDMQLPLDHESMTYLVWFSLPENSQTRQICTFVSASIFYTCEVSLCCAAIIISKYEWAPFILAKSAPLKLRKNNDDGRLLSPKNGQKTIGQDDVQILLALFSLFLGWSLTSPLFQYMTIRTWLEFSQKVELSLRTRAKNEGGPPKKGRRKKSLKISNFFFLALAKVVVLVW